MRLLRPLLTSAGPSRHLSAPLVTQDSHGRSPVISSGAFHARPLDLPPGSLMDMGFAIIGPLARPRRPPIQFLFIGPRFCSTLPSDPASRRRPLRFAVTSPPSGCEEDFHLQALEHARRTKQKARPCGRALEFWRLRSALKWTYCALGFFSLRRNAAPESPRPKNSIEDGSGATILSETAYLLVPTKPFAMRSNGVVMLPV
jgi:hypothetical protein